MMVGVQDRAKCPKCGYKDASTEFQTRNGEEWLFCGRCGYEQHTTAVVDRVRSAKVTKKVKRLYNQKKYVEAIREGVYDQLEDEDMNMSTFQEAGVLTNNKGLVLGFNNDNKDEFQITVVRVR